MPLASPPSSWVPPSLLLVGLVSLACVEQALGGPQASAKDVLDLSPAPSAFHSSLCLEHRPYTSHTRDQNSPSRSQLVPGGRKREKQPTTWNNLKKILKSERASGPMGRGQAAPQVAGTEPQSHGLTEKWLLPPHPCGW